MIQCPECQSTDIARLRDPTTGMIVRAEKSLATCHSCNHIFILSDDELSSLGPEELPGQQIMESVPCPRCSYDLRFMEIGGRCPECGATIASPRRAEVVGEVTEANRLGRVYELLMVLTLAGGVIGSILYRWPGRPRRHPAIGIGMGLVLVVAGIGILHRRQARLGRRLDPPKTYRVRSAASAGILLLLLGAAITVVSLLRLLMN